MATPAVTTNNSGWFVQTALATASCLAIVVNLLVIFVFIRRPGLRTVSNRFVLNLLVTNLISSTILIPLLLADEITKRVDDESTSIISTTQSTEINTESIDDIINDDILLTDSIEDYIIQNEFSTFSETNSTTNFTNVWWSSCSPLCYIAEGFTSLVCTASILSILLIAVDQYFAVVHPLRYHMRIDQCKSLVLIATSWITSIVFGIIGAVTPSKDDSLWNFCRQTDVEVPINNFSSYLRIAYTVLYFFLVILVPFLAICVIYLCIYSAAHRNSERMRHTNSGSITINLEAYVPVPMNGNNGDEDAKSDITEEGLMLKLDEQANYLHKQSLETLAETPQVTVENWDDNDVNIGGEMKKVHSVPIFNTIEASLTPIKSPTIENIPAIFVNKSSSTNLRKLSIFDTNYFRRKSTQSDTSSMPITPIGTPKQRAGSLKSTHSFMNTLKCRISNASLFRYREETRAAKISVIVIVMVLICYIPYGIALILHITNLQTSSALTIFDSISLIHLVFSSVISPFLFALRNRRIKREIRKIFHPTKLDADLQKLKSKVNKNTIRQFGNNVTQITTPNVKNTTFLTINNEHFSSKNNINVNCNQCCNCQQNGHLIPLVDDECKSILKRVCDKTKMWNTTKKTCNFMTVPSIVADQPNTECRSSFSSQNSSTQMSTVSTDS
ncbi:muscarinic acetylcholine receptor M4 [Chrysoperla carnea]|uniref:muscarinic acetylcholine receptor M4 n=1 Tax=Chrysoperla carnea TaxID=189513 RepID=UPI001D0848CF|nr:muscarinic acetylcholine receptor M4 [Chrysoperla carnea]